MHTACFQLESDSASAAGCEPDAGCSEWLFASGFWESVNKEAGTIFDQFEDDSADARCIAIILKRLKVVIRELAGLEAIITFTRGWDACGAPLTVGLKTQLLINELRKLATFFEGAMALGATVSCEL